jgi:hypothetical protein
MSMFRPISKKSLLGAAAVIVLIAVGFWVWQRTRLKQYEVLESPDARFKVVVYRRPIWPSAMPGQAGDAPGIVRLYDRSGRLLHEAPIEMVQQVEDLHWTHDNVTIPLVFDWKLPN